MLTFNDTGGGDAGQQPYGDEGHICCSAVERTVSPFKADARGKSTSDPFDAALALRMCWFHGFWITFAAITPRRRFCPCERTRPTPGRAAWPERQYRSLCPAWGLNSSRHPFQQRRRISTRARRGKFPHQRTLARFEPGRE